MVNINPRQFESLMRQLGVKVEDIKDAKKVIIESENGNYIITPQDVKIIKAQGTETIQIIVKEKTFKKEVIVEEKDIEILAEKANITKEEAKKILEKHEGDLASALLEIEERE